MLFSPQFEQVRRLIQARDFGKARELNALARGQFPLEPMYWIQASRIAAFTDRYREGQDCALRAFELIGNNPAATFLLLQQLRVFGLERQVRQLLAREGLALQYDALDLGAFILSTIGETDWALQLVNRAIAQRPQAAAAWMTRGHIEMFMGNFGAAEQSFGKGLQFDRSSAFARVMLSKLRKQTPASNHIADLRRELSVAGRSAKDRGLLLLALHKELDDIGEYTDAADALTEGCQLIRGSLDYSVETDIQLVQALMSMELPPAEGPIPEGGPVPVFIVGMHRSGTTLLEQLLSGSPLVAPLGELVEFTRAMRHATDHLSQDVVDATVVARAPAVDFSEVGRRYLDGVSDRLSAHHRYFTDKMPSNFLNVGFILRALPQAKVIRMVRDPVETGFSNLREIFSDRTNRYSYDQGEFAAFYRLHLQLMDHWHAEFPGRILDVRYADLTAGTEATLKRICAFVGLAFDPEMLKPEERKHAVTTASVAQVRSEVDSLATTKNAKWQRYRGALATLIAETDGLRERAEAGLADDQA